MHNAKCQKCNKKFVEKDTRSRNEVTITTKNMPYRCEKQPSHGGVGAALP